MEVWTRRPSKAGQTVRKMMSNITRRAALGGLALLSSGAATIAAAAPTSPPVDAELMQLGRELAIAEQAFHAACEAEGRGYRIWEATYPRPDKTIVMPRDYRQRIVDCLPVKDPFGKLVSVDGDRALHVADPSAIIVPSSAYNFRGRIPKLLRNIRWQAERWWEDYEHAIAESGVLEARAAVYRACRELDRLCIAAYEHQATSLEGVAVMLRAAALSNLGTSTCLGTVGDHRFVKLAGSVNAMLEARS